MLIAYTNGLDLIRALRPVIAQLRKYSADAADQVERAAGSVIRNIAEGDRQRGRNPVRFFAMAHGSANEIRGQLDVTDAWGWEIDAGHVREILDREIGLLYGLTHPKRERRA